jgi:hypothetical protein
VRQRSVDGQSIVYAASSQEQGVRLDRSACSPSTPPASRWNASRPSGRAGAGALAARQASVYVSGESPRDYDSYLVKTNLTAAQVRESFSTPRRSVLGLPAYIEIAERSGWLPQAINCSTTCSSPGRFFCRDGSTCLFGQFKILPLWRRRQNGFEWRGGRVSALCSVQGD